MTGIVCIRQPHAVHVFTDGALFDPDGKLMGLIAKPYLAPQIGAVFAFRGQRQTALVKIEKHLLRMQSIAQFKSEVETTIKASFEADSAEILKAFGPGGLVFDVIAAGYTDGRPESFFFASHDGSGPPAWKVIELDPVCSIPGVEIGRDVKPFDAVREGIAMMELQRKVLVPFGANGVPTHIVGGFVQMTTVTADAIKTEVIHRWSDEIGRPISPR